MSVFDIILNKFFKNLVDKHQYNLKKLETEWNLINEEMKSNINYDISFKANLESQNTTTSTYLPLVPPVSTIDTITEELNNMSISPPDEKCPYKITRGTHANTVCNSKIKPGHIVCTKHIKYEETLKKVQAGSVTSTNTTHDKSKPRLKLTSKQVSNQPYKLDFLNTCKSYEEESTCINFDELQVHEINKMFKELIDSNGNEYKDKNLTLEEIFLDKKKKLVEYYIKKETPLKITYTKWNQIEQSLNDVVSFRTKNDVILNLVRYKQSKYFVDKNSLVIVKSMDEPIVIGRINRYEQPTLEIDGYTYDLILKYNFDFDLEYLNNEGKEAHEAFLKSKTKPITPIVDNSIPEENKNF